MRLACWITQAIDTHPEYVILIAFPLQDLFRERTSMLYIMATLYAINTDSHKNKVQEVIHNFSILHFIALDITQKAKIIMNKRQLAHCQFDLHLIS